jgi:beta-fructofuranosidase
MSEDFLHWTMVDHHLHSAKENGMWECPDFFPVSKNSPIGLDTSTNGPDIKHVLKVSLFNTGKEYYTIGTYILDKDIYIPDEGSVESDSGMRYDYGKFYASKSFFDSAKNRRILWGWVNESSSAIDDIKKGWSGLQV